MEVEIIDKMLCAYKFSNVPLEKTVIQLLALDGISSSCLQNTDNEDLLSTLSFMLVDYKFNRIYKTRRLIAEDVLKWIKANGSKLRGYGYGGGGSTWG